MNQPVRTLGAFDTTCIVVGAIVGVGIFFTPSRVASLVPSPGLALTAWALAGALAMAGALAFAELGRRVTGEGAQYRVLRDAFGPMPAFMFVFCNATAVQAGAIGIIAIICARNLAAALGDGTPLSGKAELAVAASLVAAVTAANLAGVRWGARVQNITVIAKVSALLMIAGLAAFATRSADAAPALSDPARSVVDGALSPIAGVLAALVPAFFAYGGWQHALWISGEVTEPRRNLPLGILAGTGVVVVVYLAANAAYLSLLGHAGVATSQALAADSVATVMPGVGRRLVAGAIAVSALGVLNAQLLSGPRLISGMASDGRFFAAFARTGATPVGAILLLSAASLVLMVAAGFSGIDRLLTGVVVIDGIFFGATALALFFLKPDGKPLPLAKVAAGVFVVGELALLFGSTLDPGTRSALPIAVGWILAACVLYLAAFRDRAWLSPNTVLCGVGVVCGSWYAMMMAHELGHVLAALWTRSRLDAVIVPWLGLSRTDFAPNDHVWAVVLAGPVVGCVLPLMVSVVLGLAQPRSGWSVIARFVAGFCLVANGAYMMSGIVSPVGDARDLIELGAVRREVLALGGAVAVAVGLFCWSGIGAAFGVNFRGRTDGMKPPEPERGMVGKVYLLAAVIVAAVVVVQNVLPGARSGA